jgi:GNAT superfamily N-acetyltransferase
VKVRTIDPKNELARLRAFLIESDPHDYLLEIGEEWTREGRLLVGTEEGSWVAFGRLNDLGHGEGWVGALRVARAKRGMGLGGEFLNGLIADARSIGLTELRAVIEDENTASRRLFARVGFRPMFEMTLRCGKAESKGAAPLRPAHAGEGLDGPIGWIPARTGRVDLLPGSEGGRLGRWDPQLLLRWTREGKLYRGPGLAAGVLVDWQREPRTMWVNPLQGEPGSLFPAVARLAEQLGQEEWQAFLPSTEDLRRSYAGLGLNPNPLWGDRIHLYERVEAPPALR